MPLHRRADSSCLILRHDVRIYYGSIVLHCISNLVPTSLMLANVLLFLFFINYIFMRNEL